MTREQLLTLKRQKLLLLKSKYDLKTFLRLHFEIHKGMEFFENWHIDYLCKILESTLPRKNGSLGNLTQSTPSQEASLAQNLNTIVNSADSKNSELQTQEKENAAGIEMSFGGCGVRGAGSYLVGNDQAECEHSAKNRSIPTQPQKVITQLMINMPPSYGKTEIIARTFIAWALGNFPQRKFFYISYSDELCKKISNEVRDLMKSDFWAQIFGRSPVFLQDNVSEFSLKSGGGLFCTTLKASLTGFHAHQILIDDPIKVADMSSRAERNRVNQAFKESVLSRLQDRNSNITILMQRLGDEDLCGFLLDPKHFPQEMIDKWQVVKLKALEDSPKVYEIGDFSYYREAGEALFPNRHTREELEEQRIKMGEDEFSTQYLQEPQVSEAGYFESVYFKTVPCYELGEHNSYIFVDNATSLESSADNRAIVLVGCEAIDNRVRYILKDCVYGIWSEEESIEQLVSMMSENPAASVYIESDGGGLTLERLLQKELNVLNTKLKYQHKPPITNTITCYPANRKVSKVEKIKAMRSYYNTGDLVFLHNARGLDQVKKELLAFNPAKPFKKDDCIDALASAMAHPNVIPKRKVQNNTMQHRHLREQVGVWRV